MAKAKTSTKAKEAVVAKAAPAKGASTVRHFKLNAPKSTSLFNGQLVMGALVAELLGTFFIAYAFLSTQGSPIFVAIAILVCVTIFGGLSGSHINPAVTIGFFLARKISAIKAAGYVVAQVLGGMLALVVVSHFLGTGPVDPGTGEAARALQLPAPDGDWRPFFGEALGALVLGIGVAVAILSGRKGLDAGFTVGGAFLVGVLLASAGSVAILNPAVALAGSAFQGTHFWTAIFVYGLGPIVGTTIGVCLYRFIDWDTRTAAAENK